MGYYVPAGCRACHTLLLRVRVVDIYSRYLVHYDVFDAETSQNAVRFLSEAMNKHFIQPRCLVLHSVRAWSEAMPVFEYLGLNTPVSEPTSSTVNPR